MFSKTDTSHPACKGFKVDSFKSIWIASKDFSNSRFGLNLPNIPILKVVFYVVFFNSSFPDKSSGCNSEIHPAGTYRIHMLFFVISSLKSDTWWALNMSKIHKAGTSPRDSGKCSRRCSTYDTMALCYDNSMLFIEILRQLVFVLLCIVMYDVIRSSP